MPKKKDKTWYCPTCKTHEGYTPKILAYGASCPDLLNCTQEKNINAQFYIDLALSEKKHSSVSIGIAEIANQDEENGL